VGAAVESRTGVPVASGAAVPQAASDNYKKATSSFAIRIR
jgi:hypothetical protein